jgi:hypothetical protein
LFRRPLDRSVRQIEQGFAAAQAAAQRCTSPGDLNRRGRRSASTPARETRPHADKPVFLRRAGDNHSFTMTMNAAVLSTKKFTPQVPLYH